MKKSLAFIVMVLVFFGGSVLSQTQDNSDTSLSKHQSYLGVYSLGNKQYINIGLISDAQTVTATFTKTGDVRYLTSKSDDTFSYGPTRSTATPISGTIKFLPAKDGKINGLQWNSEGQPTKTAKRMSFYFEEVKFSNGNKANLVGTLITPLGKKKYPLAVMIPQSDRYDLWDVAMWLIPQGIGILVYDQRNTKTGKSVGETVGRWYSEQQTAYAEDAAAAVKFIRNHPRIDSKKVGVIGWSGGGWMGAKVVAYHVKDLAFYVNIAANASDWYDQARHWCNSRMLREGFSDAEIAQANQYFDVYYGVAQKKVDWETYTKAKATIVNEKWFELLNRVYGINNTSLESALAWGKNIEASSPANEFTKVTCPTLGIFFEFDQSNPPDTPTLFKKYLEQADNKDFSIKIFPSLNHGAWKVEGYRFKPNEVKQRSPEVFSTIIAWVKGRI